MIQIQSILQRKASLVLVQGIVLFLALFSGTIWGQSTKKQAGSPPDSLKQSVVQNDSLNKDSLTTASPIDARQTVIKDSLKKITDLKSKVIYHAEDSIIFDVEKKMLFLYGNAEIEYDNIKVTADRVTVDWEKQMMTAEGTPQNDSTQSIKGKPVFTQGEDSYTALRMTYNFKTQKGRVENARTAEGDGFIFAETVKRNPDNSFFGLDGKYTTCNDEEHPHFYIKSRKMKVIPNDKIISGPLNLVIEEFPLPIIIPFGFFPNTKKKDAGIVLPTYGEQGDRGFFLRGLGYFWGKSQYVNVLATADIFSKGGWNLGANSQYNYRNHFRGNISGNYGIAVFGEKTDSLYQRSAAWRISASHQQTINQNTTLNATISIDRNFNRTLNLNQGQYFANNQNSAITLNKSKIGNTPFSFTLGAGMTQDVNNNRFSLDAPTATLYMASQTPFRNISPKSSWDWLKQLNFSYSANATNKYANVDDSILLKVIQNPNAYYDVTRKIGGKDSVIQVYGRTFVNNGIVQRIPVSTKVKLFKYINISPSFNYNEYWNFSTVEKYYDETSKKVETKYISGLQTARDFNFQASATTTLYALYGLSKSKRQIVVRHMMVPTLSYTLKPDFSTPAWGYFKSYNDTVRSVLYNRFEGAAYGSPSAGESQALSFGLQNTVEMKIRKKESFQPDFPEKEDKYDRVRLLDNFGINGSYNFAADSFQLSPINIAARTTIFKNKISINSGATVNPYAIDALTGRQINAYMWDVNRSVGRITSANISLNTSFAAKKKKTEPLKKSKNFDEAEYEMIQKYMDGYMDFSIPWTISVSYLLNYSKPGASKAVVSNVLNFTGDLSLTEKWKVGYSSGYDFQNNDISYMTSFNITRDLHCWQMSFNWIPFGPTQSYFFTLNVKSPTLQDLKLNKRKVWTDRFRTF